jgi:acetyltransferase EpsM
MTNLYIWGAGGHGKVVFDCAAATVETIAFLDDNPKVQGSQFCGRPVFAPLIRLQVDSAGASFIIAIGDNRMRAARFLVALEYGLPAGTIVHPAAVVSRSAVIGEGTVVMPGATINADARIGRNCIVNTGAVVEHDCCIGDHVHLAPRSTLGGGVSVDSFSLIGIGAVVIPGVVIGDGAVVGAGAVVVKAVPQGVIVAGVPARVLARAEDVQAAGARMKGVDAFVRFT